KGRSNDQLQQQWLSTAGPFMESNGIQVQAHKDNSHYALDYPLPCTFDAGEKRCNFNDPCTWDDVLGRWRARAPRNAEMVALFQESFSTFQVRTWPPRRAWPRRSRRESGRRSRKSTIPRCPSTWWISA